MKFQVTLKCPDALEQKISDNLSDANNGYTSADEYHKIMNQCEKWFKYGELLTVEIDTEADTCVVIKQ